MILKGYKYRIYPNKTQAAQIEQTFGCCRFIYNLALETKKTAYSDYGKNFSSYDLCYQLTDLKKDLEWLTEVDSQALQASVKKLDKAYKSFFKGGGFPKFKKRANTQSFQAPHEPKRIDWENKTLTIAKIKNIPIVLSRKFEGKIKTVTISRTATGKYFASILVEINSETPTKSPITFETTRGMDLGLTDFAIFDNDETVSNPKFLKNDLERMKVMQRRASRKIKGSNNRKKAFKKVAILHEKISNKRLNFLHTLSHRLTNENQVNSICAEDLKVKNMVKNHNLAQGISDVSWSKFVDLLKYKSEWRGKNLIQVNTFFPSTKTCSNCGNINDDLTLADRNWQCGICHSTHNRDVNAAKNIKIMGLKQSGWRPSVESVELRTLVRAKKQKFPVL